jgi:putative endonuclease
MKQHLKQGQKNQIGAIGEQIAATFLQQKGLTIIDTNYLKKWGEIDIVARETLGSRQKVHFIEVKTVSYETRAMLESAVSRGTWRPEENVTFQKLAKLHRTVETWIIVD